MSSSDEIFPFDGTCDCSKDADFTLTFDDGSCLKTSKCLLEMASRVFKTAIGECEQDGTLQLSDTSTDAWILILNFIHPAGRSDSYAEEVVSERLATLTDVLRQCEKYGFVPLQQDLDRRITSFINASTHTIHSTREPVPIGRHQEAYLVIDPNRELFQAVLLFDLPLSEEALASYLISVLKENNSRLRELQKVGIPLIPCKIDEAISSISHFVAQMHASGRYRMCSLLLQKMMDAKLCISLDLVNVERMTFRFT